MERIPVVYIMGNGRPTLYVGVTSDLSQRLYQYRNKLTKGFVTKYDLDKLLYYEVCDDMSQAIQREKQLKSWKREWKLDLIAQVNPKFKDLSETI